MAEARDEMMRQIDHLQKENRTLKEDVDDENVDGASRSGSSSRFSYRSQSVMLDWELSPFTSFDHDRDYIPEVSEISCQREECQTLFSRYKELADQVQNIGFEPEGNLSQNASFEVGHVDSRQGFEPEVMTPTIEIEESFICEAFRRAEAARAVERPELSFQSSRVDDMENVEISHPIGKTPEFLSLQDQTDGQEVKEEFIAENNSMNLESTEASEVREEFIAENSSLNIEVSVPEEVEFIVEDTSMNIESSKKSVALSRFTPEKCLSQSSSDDEMFIGEGFVSMEIQQSVQMDGNSLKKTQLSLPSVKSGGTSAQMQKGDGASSEYVELPPPTSPLAVSAKRYVECVQELKNRCASESNESKQNQQTKPHFKRRHRRTLSENLQVEQVKEVLRQMSYEAEDISPSNTLHVNEAPETLEDLQHKNKCLEFRRVFLEEKISNLEKLYSNKCQNLEKEKQTLRTNLENEILQRRHLEEEIVNLNVHLDQTGKMANSDVANRNAETASHITEANHVLKEQVGQQEQILEKMRTEVEELKAEKRKFEELSREAEERLMQEIERSNAKDDEINSLRGQVHIHGVELSEKKYYNQRMEENLENMQEEIESLYLRLNEMTAEKKSDAKTESSSEEMIKSLQTQLVQKEDENSKANEKVKILETVKSDLCEATSEIQKLNEEAKVKEILISEMDANKEKLLSEHEDVIKKKDNEINVLLAKFSGQEKLNKPQTQRMNSVEVETMKLSSQVFELNEMLVEKANYILELESEVQRLKEEVQLTDEKDDKSNHVLELENEVKRLKEEVDSAEESMEFEQYREDMEKTVKEKDAYIRKLEEHLLGQNLLESPRLLSREATPTQSPRGRDAFSGLSSPDKTPTQSPSKEKMTVEKTTSIYPPVPSLQLGNSNLMLPGASKDEKSSSLANTDRSSQSKSSRKGKRKTCGGGRFRDRGPLLPWRSPLDDFSDQSTISASSSPRFRGEMLGSHFIPELHSSFRSRSPSGSSVSGSVDGSERIISGLGPDQDGHVALEQKHFELIDEISELRRDLRETKSIYTQENALLQEALDREKWMKESMKSKLGMSGTIVNFDFSTELIALRQKVAILQETNKMLHSENDRWLRKIQDQEQLVLQLKDQLGTDPDDFLETNNLFGKQVMMLQKQRDELLENIREKDSENRRLSNTIGDMSVLEENLRREKDLLKVKLKEKEDVEIELSQRKLELERSLQIQQKLEDVIYHKNEIEKELMKQKRLLELELAEIEAKLQEKEEMLEIQKNQLLGELKGKETGQQLTAPPLGRSGSSDNVCRLNDMLADAEREHSEAIHSLRSSYRRGCEEKDDTELQRDTMLSVTSEHGHKV